MKKTLKRIVCFLLAFVVMVSIPLDIQAHAVATETWMVYALITYLAGMGITFTVAGGVDAMVQAMEEKVKDYEHQNNIIDFYEYVRNNNVRLLPNNNQDPDGNPFFDLFFTGAAVEAIQAFANWLTSEGGWGEGFNYNLNELFYYGWIDDVYQVITLPNFEVVEYDSQYRFYKLNLLNEPTLIPVETLDATLSQVGKYRFMEGTDSNIIWTVGFNGGNIAFYKYVSGKYNTYYYNNLINAATYFGYDASTATHIVPYFTQNPSTNEYTVCRCALLMPDGTFISANNSSNSIKPFITQLDSSIDVITPEELQEQFPSVDQGVSIRDAISVPMGDPTLAEWAQRMEETFGLTGTIPKPVPEVIADPDVVPQPSPVPTPPVYEDVDGLGLPSLAETMKNKFPFCLPYDLGRVFQIFYAEPVAPYWEVDLFSTLGNRVPFVGDTAFTIDLAEYEDLGRISRWMTTIGYTLLLILITRQTTKW